MFVRKILWLLLMPLLSVPVFVRAQEGSNVRRGTPERHGRLWVERDGCSLPVKSGGRLVLRADLGTVTVRTCTTDEVQCAVRLTAYTPAESEARSSFQHTELTARRMGSGDAYLQLRYDETGRPMRRLGVAFDLQVPAHFNLDLETAGGAIQVAALDGELRAVTAGGAIRTGDVTGPVRLQTAGGDIELGNIGQRLEARTAGGGIRVGNVNGDAYLETRGGEILAGMIAGTVHAETAAGNITLRAASGPAVVETAGGRIQLGECGGSVRAETAGGSIHLDGARGRVDAQTAGGSIDLLRVMSAVRAETAAGHILAQIDANRRSFGPSSLQSTVGDVQVYLPDDLPLTIKALIDTAAGHTISSDFPLTVTRDAQDDFGLGPMDGTVALRGGGAPLNLHTTLGNIEIRRLDTNAAARLKSYQQAFWKDWQQRMREQQQETERMLSEKGDQ
jgi:hypothetical protein